LSQRIYLDDCANDKELAALLRAAGHHVVIPAAAGLTGRPDPAHLAYAAANNLVLLTKNPNDFKDLHDAGQFHTGIFGVYQDNDLSRDMSYAEIVRAIANLENAGITIAGEFHVLNAWRY
jgi:hypothetical protein